VSIPCVFVKVKIGKLRKSSVAIHWYSFDSSPVSCSVLHVVNKLRGP
jgi:hypothetical protein